MSVTPYRIPNAAEREVLFNWLKRGSSWTGWNLLFEKLKVFSAVVERAFKDDQTNPRPDGRELIYPDRMSHVLACEAAFQAALERLRDGDRRCFLFLGASGYFSQGIMAVEWWRKMDGREKFMGGAEFSPNQSPHWPEIERAMNDALDVLSDLDSVLQDRYKDVPAPIDNLDDYPPENWAALVRRVPADPALAQVPTPPDPPVYVKTRRTIREFGIWEPVALVNGVYRLDGAMNYLHGGQPAPTIGFAGDGQRQEGRPTIWHLLWADHRYGKLPVPAEEATYQFGFQVK